VQYRVQRVADVFGRDELGNPVLTRRSDMTSILALSDFLANRGARVATALLLTLPLAVCNDTSAQPAESGRFYGAAVPLGAGTARSYVLLENGTPTEVGVALSEQALHDLPGAGHANGSHAMTESVLALPAQGERTPFEFILLGWNPQGHPPQRMYDVPHFDFHFYTITDAARSEIDPTLPTFEQRASRIPAREQVPAGYVGEHDLFKAPIPSLTIPRMGLHWLDPKTPELNGQSFTTTFIYGSWDGQMIFAEPMITKAFLESRPNFAQPIAQPARFGAAGYYPTRYTITWDGTAQEYRVALSGLTKREQ
jgi:hypothetical protein